VEIALKALSLGVGRLDDPRARASEFGFGRALGGEVADDRRHLVRPARGDSSLELTLAIRQLEREVEGLALTWAGSAWHRMSIRSSPVRVESDRPVPCRRRHQRRKTR
jgi:hypothetical protein